MEILGIGHVKMYCANLRCCVKTLYHLNLHKLKSNTVYQIVQTSGNIFPAWVELKEIEHKHDLSTEEIDKLLEEQMEDIVNKGWYQAAPDPLGF